MATLAGSGAAIDWPIDFDPTAPHAAKDWVLENSGAGQQWMALDQGKLYWAGGVGVGRYVPPIRLPVIEWPLVADRPRVTTVGRLHGALDRFARGLRGLPLHDAGFVLATLVHARGAA